MESSPTTATLPNAESTIPKLSFAVNQLPQEVCSRIVFYSASRDVFTLARTSKALQRAAEPRIYETVILRSPQAASHGCTALLARDAFRAPYVRRFVLFQEPRRAWASTSFQEAPPTLWQAVQRVLTLTVNLDSLVLHEPRGSPTWILDHPDIRFQLRDANLNLRWDHHLVEFFLRQPKLRSLSTGDAGDSVPLCPLQPGALVTLEAFNGPLLIAADLLEMPLTHLQMIADEETGQAVPAVVSSVAAHMPTLVSLSILGAGEEYMLEVLQLVSAATFAPQLRYFGMLTTAPDELPAVYRCFMKLPKLEFVEVNVTRWNPQPHELFQRMLVLDMQIYCTTLRQVVFWIGQRRVHWYRARDGEWACVQQHGRVLPQDTFWRHGLSWS